MPHYVTLLRRSVVYRSGNTDSISYHDKAMRLRMLRVTLATESINMHSNNAVIKGGTSMKKQSDAVYAATMSVLAEAGVSFEDGMNVEEVMTKEIRSKIHAIVCEGFRQGQIEFKDTPSNQEKLANPSKLSGYVSGLVSNWFRKDTRLNGGEKYVAKNPGSRAGSTDPQLKALRQLLTKFKGTEKAVEIEKHINTRLAQIQAEKAKSFTVDISALPADLVESLGLDNE